MIEHPYVYGGQLDRQALDAAHSRAVYYGSLGVMDPRTYTLDPYLIRRTTKASWRATVAMSLHAMVIGVAAGAALGYLGYDPLRVTPEFTQPLEEYDPFSIDLKNLYM